MNAPSLPFASTPGPAPAASPAQWACALMAVLAPTLVAYHTPPSMTFFNQVMAVLGWGLWLSFMPTASRAHAEARLHETPGWARRGMLGLCAVFAIYGVASLGAAGLWAQLPIGLALMHAGLCAAAGLVFVTAWQQRERSTWDQVVDLFLWGLTLAGTAGLLIGLLQAFIPQWTDGMWLAESNMAGRAVGNLRQPNHLSTLLVWAIAAAAALGGRGRLPARVSALLVALFIWGVVLTASRTGMLGMGFLTAWGLLDRRMPPVLRRTVIAAPLVYGLWWGGMYAWSHLSSAVTFAAESRLNDNSDISSSRFKIWANVLDLVAANPWWGVGVGEFNVAWTFTPFPTRPIAFFDHAHNVLMQWAVELGLPLTLLMTLASILAMWPLLRAWWPRARTGAPDAAPDTPDDAPKLQAVLGASGVIVGISSLHSMLEYPLWYGHLLLPTAFAWGLGLAAASRLRGRKLAHSKPTHAPRAAWLPTSVAGTGMVLAGLWCALDYLAAAEVYAPHAGAGPLSERIAFSQQMPWWGYQADYAEVNGPDDDEPSLPPARFARTLHNLVDARLMIAYARSLAEHGEVDKARFVVARLQEFRNPAGKAFMAPCAKLEASSPAAARPFQCSPPQRQYSWRELLPQP
jgi:O-antigen ligase